jgi:hypothetical protein
MVRRINPLTAGDWDETSRGLGGAVFHESPWARVLTRTYGYRPIYFTIADSNATYGVLPVMEINSWLTGRRGVSLPFTDECHPVGCDAVTFRTLLDQAIAFGQTRRWRYLECRGGRDLLTATPASVSYYGHHLNLRGDESQLFARVDSAGRRAIRKAQQSEITVEFAHTQEATAVFYALLCKTRKRHGLPPQPWSFFAAIHDEILSKRRGCIVIARRDRTPIAGAVFLHSGSTALYKFGASDETYQQFRGNNLVMWEAIRWHARQGFATLDLGRTSMANSGLRQFKLNLGAEERIVDYFKYDLRTDTFVSDTDRSTGWHSRFFRSLPQPMSRLIGTVLYRHIA